MASAKTREPEAQTTASVLMIRPARFQANLETAGTNAFQRSDGTHPVQAVLLRAQREFDGLVRALLQHDVDVRVIDDTLEPPKPDAVFPNNWVSFHADGRAVLYPLLAPSRRAEVRTELLEEVAGCRRLVDLRHLGESAEFLEGTGSLVLDRAHRQAFACLSARTSEAALAAFCRELDFAPVAFHATDARGMPIYHTNVMLSVGTRLALACLEAITDVRERREVEGHLGASGHEIVAITREQMEHFAGNVLELRSRSGSPLLVLSERARRALRAEQLRDLERHARLVSADLDTIEIHGGGSARCMIAEIF